eukprot:scaffold7174_cov143-Amphora_coffeaeformis.AAC.5
MSTIGWRTRFNSKKHGVFYLDKSVSFKIKTRKRSVLVHGPLCVASDSRRIWHGKRPPVATDKFENSVNATLEARTLGNNLHQGFRYCAAFYRDCVTPVEVNALLETGLSKQSWDAPTAANLHKPTRPAAMAAAAAKHTDDNDKKTRVMDNLAINEGRYML